MSTTEGEPAQEWPYLRGSLFTHHLLAALRGLGDVDANGAVTLAEAYTYSYRNTLSQSLLGSAGSWSTWDAFGGGGMLTDMMKYDKVDRATEALRRADMALAAFSRELADVDLPQVRGVQVNQMMRPFDVWFDNIFSDMAVRSRIEDASRRVVQALHQVEQALAALEQKGAAVSRELTGLDARREQLLLH